MHFKTRSHAGLLLAEVLAEKYKGVDAVIYALPRGGVPLGLAVAQALNMPLDLIIPRKIGHPNYAEYAIGAVTEGGEAIFNEHEIAQIDSDWLEQQKQEEITEAKRRREYYLADRKPVSATGKLAILVDDGIATGLTMRAAIRDLKNRHPDKIVVAVPVMPADTAKTLDSEVDDVVALLIDPHYQGSVGSYYQYFYQLRDDEVILLLNKLDEDNIPKPLEQP
ncbi:MAG: phosphoribosyltransferase family protein [Porticoccus sp.]